MKVGELKKSLEGHDDDMVVAVTTEDGTFLVDGASTGSTDAGTAFLELSADEELNEEELDAADEEGGE